MEMKLKRSLPGYTDLLDRVQVALTAQRLPLLIAIDGAEDCGKSSLANWLAWQLGMPAIQLDLYLIGDGRLAWHMSELKNALARRHSTGRPIIIEGILILDALDQIGRKPDFVVHVRGGQENSSLFPQIEKYRARRKPVEISDYTIEGYRT